MFHDLVSLASKQYEVVKADRALFQAAASAYDMGLASQEWAADARKKKDWVGVEKAGKQGFAAQRALRANLTALKLSADVRSKKSGEAAAAEEPDDDDWGDLL